MPEQKIIKIDEETHEKLKSLSLRKKISMKDIIGVLVDMAENYGLLEPDWQDRLLKETLEGYRAKLLEDLKKRLDIEKFKTKMKFKYMLLQEYIKSLRADERREFIESLMIDLRSPEFLEHIGEMELIYLDGKRRLIRFKNGKPDFSGIKGEVIECEKGYHIKGNYCECDMWKVCPIKQQELIEKHHIRLFGRNSKYEV